MKTIESWKSDGSSTTLSVPSVGRREILMCRNAVLLFRINCEYFTKELFHEIEVELENEQIGITTNPEKFKYLRLPAENFIINSYCNNLHAGSKFEIKNDYYERTNNHLLKLKRGEQYTILLGDVDYKNILWFGPSGESQVDGARCVVICPEFLDSISFIS